jgi:hypothetical protein
VKSLVLSFEGYGTTPAGNGVTLKVWNHTAGAWQQTQTGNGGTDETLTIAISATMDYLIPMAMFGCCLNYKSKQ